MSDLAAFPDPVAALMDLFTDLVSDVDDVVHVTPADLQARLAAGRLVIRVRIVGGNDDRITDYARLDVDVYAPTYAAGQALAEQVRQRLISKPHRTARGVVDRAETEVRPQEIPYDDPAVRLFTATYRVSMRRRVP